jgi:hypothetical protein
MLHAPIPRRRSWNVQQSLQPGITFKSAWKAPPLRRRLALNGLGYEFLNQTVYRRPVLPMLLKFCSLQPPAWLLPGRLRRPIPTPPPSPCRLSVTRMMSQLGRTLLRQPWNIHGGYYVAPKRTAARAVPRMKTTAETNQRLTPRLRRSARIARG